MTNKIKNNKNNKINIIKKQSSIKLYLNYIIKFILYILLIGLICTIIYLSYTIYINNNNNIQIQPKTTETPITNDTIQPDVNNNRKLYENIGLAGVLLFIFVLITRLQYLNEDENIIEQIKDLNINKMTWLTDEEKQIQDINMLNEMPIHYKYKFSDRKQTLKYIYEDLLHIVTNINITYDKIIKLKTTIDKYNPRKNEVYDLDDLNTMLHTSIDSLNNSIHLLTRNEQVFIKLNKDIMLTIKDQEQLTRDVRNRLKPKLQIKSFINKLSDTKLNEIRYAYGFNDIKHRDTSDKNDIYNNPGYSPRFPLWYK